MMVAFEHRNQRLTCECAREASRDITRFRSRVDETHHFDARQKAWNSLREFNLPVRSHGHYFGHVQLLLDANDYLGRAVPEDAAAALEVEVHEVISIDICQDR